MHPTSNLVSTITSDRVRHAGTARLVRAGKQPPGPRRARRLRALASRVAFTTPR